MKGFPGTRTSCATLMCALLFQLLLSSLAQASSIQQAEYFLDVDPGEGNGTSIPVFAGETISFSAELATSSLAAGLHRIYVRVQDQQGNWSLADCRSFRLLSGDTPPAADSLVAAEYFMDTDPGSGQGTALTVDAGTTVQLSEAIPTEDMPSGLHKLFLRVMDSRGVWSLADVRSFILYPPLQPPVQNQIEAAEYFLDTDPGQGAATSIPLDQGAEALLQLEVDLEGVDTGMHRFYLRVQDQDGQWSIADCRMFRKVPDIETSAEQNLVAAEYFINLDPGPGNGIPFAIPLDGAWGDSMEVVQTLADIEIPVGYHQVGLRFRDSWGSWSSVHAADFIVGPYLHILPAWPPTLSWEGDLGGSQVHVYRADHYGDPFIWIATTGDPGYTDLEPDQTGSKALYRITQEATGRRSNFRYPE